MPANPVDRLRLSVVVGLAVQEWAERHWPELPASDTEVGAAIAGARAALHSTLPALVQGVVGHIEAEGILQRQPLSIAAQLEPRDLTAPVDTDSAH